MSNQKYKVGQRLLCYFIHGTVVPNCKLPGDICVKWDNGEFSSYDEEWLDEHAVLVGVEPKGEV